MKTSKPVIAAGATLLAAALVTGLWFNSRDAQPERPTAPLAANKSSERPRPAVSAAPLTTASEPVRDATPAGADPDANEALQQKREAALIVLDDAATTYDAAQLPVIDKYLYDKDAAVRKAAMDSMIVLGDASAGPLLRDAAKSAANPEEQKALLDAADFVELPSMTGASLAEHLKNSTKQGGDRANARERRHPERSGGLNTTRPQAPAPGTTSSQGAPAPAAPNGQ